MSSTTNAKWILKPIYLKTYFVCFELSISDFQLFNDILSVSTEHWPVCKVNSNLIAWLFFLPYKFCVFQIKDFCSGDCEEELDADLLDGLRLNSEKSHLHKC